ncbi:MAG TPA: Xaa-Pro peptidase family protein [Geminicoccaceae bacterium]|nr:Xaa-Pro peptidase family protein [Geminicoccaceae bacterium]
MTSPADDLTFSEAEYQSRRAAVRRRMAERDLDVCLISTPENIFYLTGLDHWGYFASHVLLVPADGEIALITRAMEQVTIAHRVRNARFEGHEDHETAAEVAVRLLSKRAQQRARIGLEQWSSGLPFGLAAKLMADLPEASWVDVTGLIDALRLVKSPAEQRCMRAAAKVSDAAMRAAIETIRAGASERAVAAECHRAMIEAGGTFPGFGPFIRPTARLGEEHTTWGEGTLSAGDAVFLELSGCVRRYHAPMGRLVFLGPPSARDRAMAEVCHKAFDAVLAALRPGALAREVYAAWQRVVDGAGLSHYHRHHCGYLVGIGFPPSWTGGNRVTGLRSDSDLALKTGMAFHILSWLMGTGQGDHFVSDTVLLTGQGPEVLTTAPRDLLVR